MMEAGRYPVITGQMHAARCVICGGGIGDGPAGADGELILSSRGMTHRLCDDESRAPVLPDPLREEFDRLERDVKARERREIQARCPHAITYDMRTMGGNAWRLCADCGSQIPLP